jgi:hypothetical protein
MCAMMEKLRMFCMKIGGAPDRSFYPKPSEPRAWLIARPER